MEKNKYRESVLYTINVYIPQLLLSFTGCLAWGNTVDEYNVGNHVLPPFFPVKDSHEHLPHLEILVACC